MSDKSKPTPHGRDGFNIEPKVELTEEEKRKIYLQAVAEIEAEVKEKKKEELLEAYKKLAKQQMIPEEELIPVLIDLAGHADRIRIDGVEYFHGVTYNVPKVRLDTINEIIARTWVHERSIGGANDASYRRPRNVRLTPGSENASYSHLLHS